MTVYAGYSLASVEELTAIEAADRTDRFLLYVGEKNRWYRYDPNATGTPDNDNTINPDDSEGRWLAVGAASSGGGGGGGGESYVGVQNGRPTETPTATGIIIADSRSDRGTLWISVGTDSPNDWKVFGSRPIRNPDFSNPVGNVTPDFVGQQFIYTNGGGVAPFFNLSVFIAVGLTNADWQVIYEFTNT